MAPSVEALGLALPLAMVRLKQAIERMGKGETVSFRTDAPGIEEPLMSFLASSGSELVSKHEEDGAAVFSIRKGQPLP